MNQAIRETIQVFPKLFKRRWWWATIIVLLGMVFQVWLGIWQLDRMEQREAYNTLVTDRWYQEPFELQSEPIPDDLAELEYRRIRIEGQFDFEHQIALKNQNVNGRPGIQLVTPMALDENRAILVARGWIPQQQADPNLWSQFDEPEHSSIIGLAQETQLLPSGEAPEAPDTPQQEWFRLNIEAIAPQMPYELLPFFVLQLPEEGRGFTELPGRAAHDPLAELRSPMMHLNYTVQWFSFAAILGFAYLQYIRIQERRERRMQAEQEGAATEPVELSKEMKTLPQG